MNWKTDRDQQTQNNGKNELQAGVLSLEVWLSEALPLLPNFQFSGVSFHSACSFSVSLECFTVQFL